MTHGELTNWFYELQQRANDHGLELELGSPSTFHLNNHKGERLVESNNLYTIQQRIDRYIRDKQ